MNVLSFAAVVVLMAVVYIGLGILEWRSGKRFDERADAFESSSERFYEGAAEVFEKHTGKEVPVYLQYEPKNGRTSAEGT